MSVTPAESDVSSDDSGLMVEEIGMSTLKKKPVTQIVARSGEVTSSMLINVIGHSNELRGNGLYLKPENSLYQCVMCDYTTKNIAQLSRHLEKHQASTAHAATSAANKSYIVTV